MIDIRTVEVAALPPAERALVDAAQAALRRAHAPYSRFRVGAALLHADGHHTTGANFENASYGLSLCAETVAIATASAAGRLASVQAIAIAADGELSASVTGEFIAPCGRCRQLLAEAVSICGRDLRVLMCSRDGRSVRIAMATTLLPLAFGL